MNVVIHTLPSYEESSASRPAPEHAADTKVAPEDYDNQQGSSSNPQNTRISDAPNAPYAVLDSSMPPDYLPAEYSLALEKSPVPRMNVLLQVIGSWGELQAFVALGKYLKQKHEHRVRIASQPVYHQFVEDNGLEFFDLGPSSIEAAEFMSESNASNFKGGNPTDHDLDVARRAVAENLRECWKSCFELISGSKPFIADVIIANAPSLAHIHCAEKLCIPVHIMYT